MGASESTAKTNNNATTGDDEENNNNRSVWSPPPIGRFKLNTDGGCHSIHGRPYESSQDVPDDCRVERRPSGYGGILRDHRGKWVRGFSGFIGVTDCFTAELHGIHKGLELLDKLGYHGAILESDCQAAVEWINGTNTASKSKIVRDSWSIIVECRCLARNNNIDIVHVKGDDANICAHKLADLAIDKEDKYVEIEYLSQLPDDIKRLVDDEEKNRQSQQSTAGTSIRDALVLAATGVAAVGVTAWTISKVLSEQNSANSHQNNSNHGMESLLASSRQILEGSSIGKRSVWSPPPNGRFKLNTDGGCHSIHGRPYESSQDVPDDCRVERRPSGYGGILRDHRGKWVRGFRGFIGVTDCFTAELHGIHKGLELLNKLGYHGAILESDCLFVVKWINDNNNNNINTSKSKIVRDSWSIIVECRRLAHNNNIDIVHVKGDDANICAHKLADLAIDKEDKYVEIEYLSQLPDAIKRLVDKDVQTIIGYPSNSYAY